ncbi:phosphate/phosphite/phosphonate ABC transporter substrate-binding protein [Paenibacillus elgii]|uniref:phosphate/phosphite/phosphonate ABC transporter substrate-binding protein n=1 Tax=Paenibacillus elgii TaxID=189691 RepID=UPI00203C14A4|nr:PhnD/SsuA/transferrin family substrate-binding protein [Paenibacillus elgii]MCM3273318.1 phosphate/phosphite/phosphonate ABC transporter substrate-binding protein [Paenibacillus elgii]
MKNYHLNFRTDGNIDITYNPNKIMFGLCLIKTKETDEIFTKLGHPFSEYLGISFTFRLFTSYNQILSSLECGYLDGAIISPPAYLSASKQNIANIILQPLRFGIDPDTGENAEELVPFYRTIIISKNTELRTISDLGNKTVALQERFSLTHLWSVVELYLAGIFQQTRGIIVNSHKEAVNSVLSELCDAAAIFQDARNLVLAENPFIFRNTHIIHYTQPIPHDAIVTKIDLDQNLVISIKRAFEVIFNSEQGSIYFDRLFGWKGITEADDSKFSLLDQYISIYSDIMNTD